MFRLLTGDLTRLFSQQLSGAVSWIAPHGTVIPADSALYLTSDPVSLRVNVPGVQWVQTLEGASITTGELHVDKAVV